jgi:hypothetical protein
MVQRHGRDGVPAYETIMSLRRKPDHYKYWQCIKCGHVAVTKEKPDISWNDGHRCTFREMNIKEGDNGGK